MRVVHVLHSFDVGGMEKGIVTLVRGASPDVEHVVLCLARSGTAAPLLPEGTEVVELGKLPGNSVRFVARLARALRALKPDVVHTRNWGGMDAVAAARLAGIRGVAHGEHGWGMDDPRGLDPTRVRVRRFLSRWVREFTCVSNEMIGWLQDTVRVRTPITQIYNGIDTDAFRPGASPVRAELGIPAEAPVAGIVGRLDPIKNHRGLLRAFARVRVAVPEARLLVVGGGPEGDALAELAGPGVSLLGDRRDAPDILRALDVFVLSSFNEGISNTILEAMATALPVVATAVGGNPELVDDGATGALVEPDSEAALEAGLCRYFEDRTLARSHGEAGRRRAIERFDVPGMVARYEAVWRRVAGRPKDGPENG